MYVSTYVDLATHTNVSWLAHEHARVLHYFLCLYTEVPRHSAEGMYINIVCACLMYMQ